MPLTSRTGQTILKNAGALLASQLMTWSMAFALTIFLPRYLGAANVGRLVLANSLWSIATVMAAFGMDVHLTKEIARQPAKARALLRTSFVLRGVLFIFGLAGVLVYVTALHYPSETVVITCIVAAANLFYLLNGPCQAALQGLEHMEYVSLGNIVGKAVYSVPAIVILLAGRGVYEVAALLAAGALVTLLIELRSVLHLAPLSPGTLAWSPRLAWRDGRDMLRAGVPYLLSDAFLVGYMQADVVILSLLLDERAVGYYGVAMQVFGTFLFVPTILMTVVFPALSRLHTTQPNLLIQYMRRSFNLLILMAVPIGFGLLVLADPLVLRLFGPEFAKTGPVLAVMGIVLILTFQNMLVGKFLIATDRQRQWTTVQAVMGLATILLDLVLVPLCLRMFANGAIGGALSFVVTELAMLITGIVLLQRGSLGRQNVSVALRCLVAGLLMVAATWWSRGLFVAIPILVGAAVYLAALWVLRALPADELKYARNLLSSVVQQLRGREPQPAVAGREL